MLTVTGSSVFLTKVLFFLMHFSDGELRPPFFTNHIFDVKFVSDLPCFRRGPREMRRLGGFNRDGMEPVWGI